MKSEKCQIILCAPLIIVMFLKFNKSDFFS